MKLLFGWVKQFRIEHLWVLAVLVGVFAFVNTHPIRPNDFWFHIATGRETLQTGHIPQVDTFSYTRLGAPYLSNNTFWVMQVALYGVYSRAGAAWLILLTSIVITLAYGLLVKIGCMRTGNWRTAAMGGLFAVALGVDNWNVRPQVATYLFAAIILLAIYSYRMGCGRRWSAAIPIVMLVWVNSHGTFFIGLVLIAFWGVDEAWQVLQSWRRTRHWQLLPLVAPLSVGVVSGLMCLLNPLGLGILKYLTSMSTNPVIQDLILEWQPPDFTSLGGALFLVLLGFGGMMLAVQCYLPQPTLSRAFADERGVRGKKASPVSQALADDGGERAKSIPPPPAGEGRGEGFITRAIPRIDLFQLLCFLFFGYLGLRYNRAIVWFGIILAPTVAMGAADLMARFQKERKQELSQKGAQVMNLGLLFVLAALAFFSLPWFKPYWPVSPEKKGLLAYDTPIRATQFMLAEGLPAPVFHDVAFGSYFDWAAVPQYLVFVDPRFELYPVEVWQDYMDISYASADWEWLLDKYHIQTLMLHLQNQAELIAIVRQSPGWIKLYEDEAAVIFTRQGFRQNNSLPSMPNVFSR